MKYVFWFLACAPSLLMAKGATDLNSPKITPLDAQTERLLKNSSLSEYVTHYIQDQTEFHHKADLAYQRISKKMALPKSDGLYFIYDCLFLVDEGLSSKYPQMAKADLVDARKTVREVFAQ